MTKQNTTCCAWPVQLRLDHESSERIWSGPRFLTHSYLYKYHFINVIFPDNRLDGVSSTQK